MMRDTTAVKIRGKSATPTIGMRIGAANLMKEFGPKDAKCRPCLGCYFQGFDSELNHNSKPLNTEIFAG